MKQYRITSADILQSSQDDCYLAPDDIVHYLKASSSLGGLGSAEALANYSAMQSPKIDSPNLGKIQRENNIKPGTPEWFTLWRG